MQRHTHSGIPSDSRISEALLLSPPQVKTAQFLGRLLAEHGHRAALLHGKRPQAEREVRGLLSFVTIHNHATLSLHHSGMSVPGGA